MKRRNRNRYIKENMAPPTGNGDGNDRYAEDDIREDHPAEQGIGRMRKKRKKKHYFLKFLLVVAIGVGAYFIMTSDLFSIRTIEIAGNEHYTKEQLAEMSGIRIGANMFKINMGKVAERLSGDPYIEQSKIERKPFHRIVVTVEERKERFLINDGAKYMVVDYDGMVLREAAEPPPLPLIENFEVTKAKPGEALVVTENSLLTQTIGFLRAVENSDLFFKRIVASDISVKAYLYDGLLCKGTYKNLEKNIEPLKQVILDLQQQGVERGTIIVSGNGTCTFTPQENA
ncbi:MAG: FtsQ-type POTRA domain-containing protein [Clostridiales Family XIII bacterium]|jgi:cell division protein FtsQ|nr:FtsQ-type POTRA domain-containing protein [Clostridiales Family XIII bacterium]